MRSRTSLFLKPVKETYIGTGDKFVLITCLESGYE